MLKLLNDVRAFHEACDVPVFTKPQFPSRERIELRQRLLREEYFEWLSAITNRDMVEVADALADMIYIIVGTALEFGIPLDRVWDEVQRSNMAKVDPATGRVEKRADGKVVKPENWQGPRIREALA
jgi:predicted HAD superfamily Cof-like phosphohydrolase